MFGFGRRKSQGQLAKAELNQSISHLVQAANHAAKGAGATVGPRVQVARGYVAPAATKVRDRASTGWGTTLTTLAPLAAAARDGAAQAGPLTRKAKSKTMRITGKKKQPRRRGSMMTGLLAAGAIAGVAGVAGAVALRRRREQQEWAEYDPTRTLEPMRDEVDSIEVRTPSVAKGSDGSAMTGAAGMTGAGSSAVAGGDSASTTATTKPAGVRPTDKVPAVAEGATDVSGRPADDLTKALGKDTARTNGRR